jgi:hypothetical protein
MTGFPDNDPRFLALLDGFRIDLLHNDGGTIFGLWPDLTLAYVNLEWGRFARQNGGEPRISSEWTRGRCVLDAIAEPLRPFFTDNYRRCLQEGRPWEHAYECSSAARYRQFHMTTFPVGREQGLLVVNSLRLEAVHTRVACPPLDALYRDEHGLLVQCSHCRRVRRVGAHQIWDWVPAWVTDQPPSTSHSLCGPCVGFYYSSQRPTSTLFAKSFTTFTHEAEVVSG